MLRAHFCALCGDPLPARGRIDRRYCRTSCRTLAYRHRKQERPGPRRTAAASGRVDRHASAVELVLRLDSTRVEAGNGNGRIEPDECNDLFVVIENPTAAAVDLSTYYLSDNAGYYGIAAGQAWDPVTSNPGTDFLAQFPIHGTFGRFAPINAPLRELP